MIQKLLSFKLLVLMCVMWSGLAANVIAASNVTVQTKPAIQHMVVLSKAIDNTITLEETWYNPQNSDIRIDYVYLPFLNSNKVESWKRIETQGGKLRYELKNIKGTVTEETQTVKYVNNPYSLTHSMFKTIASGYQTKDWSYVGSTVLNGKEVKKVKRIVAIKSDPNVEIAYLDPVTCIPSKVEMFAGGNYITPVLTKLYYYDEITTSSEDIFAVPTKFKTN
ncbi:hypothetical protein ACTID9_05845 [Brevibacillus fluminis]|uniref:hypothetical protein n=1 Tax=Brevibacillus fluminis TaxID=511487 RepID=UPI003F89D831